MDSPFSATGTWTLWNIFDLRWGTTSRCERSEGSLHVAAGGKRSLRRGKRRQGKRTPCRWRRKRTRPRPKSISSVKTHPGRIREGLGHVWAVSGVQSSWTAHHDLPNERVRRGDRGVQELEFHGVERRRWWRGPFLVASFLPEYKGFETRSWMHKKSSAN